MASSGPPPPLLLLLLVLLAGAARAGLHFRPGCSCYRPLRGDQRTQLGHRSGTGGRPTAGASRALPPLGTLPPLWGALPPLTSAGQCSPLLRGQFLSHLRPGPKAPSAQEAGQPHLPGIWGIWGLAGGAARLLPGCGARGGNALPPGYSGRVGVCPPSHLGEGRGLPVPPTPAPGAPVLILPVVICSQDVPPAS